MKKLAVWLIASLALAASSVWAAGVDDMAAALMEARANLVALLGATDKAEQDALQEKIHAASAKVDEAAAALLADSATPADQAAQITEFKGVWEEFKNTRETEIIPAIAAGKVDEAKALAKGIQAERMKKMKELLGALGWKEPAAQ